MHNVSSFPPFPIHLISIISCILDFDTVGMVFTIEPILVEGSRRMTVWDDGWSAVTMDGSRGAQFEHEVLITEHGAEVLTVPE